MAESPLLLYGSIILFAVISWAIYNYVLSGAGPTPSSSTTITAAAADGTNNTNGTTTTPPTTTATASTATNTTNATTAAQSQNNQELLSSYHNFDQPKRHPPHLYNPTSKQLNPSTVETGGIIPFKLTFANGYETRLANQQQQQQESDNNNNNSGEENLIITNRKQRARLFAKLFTIADRPPNRGSNVVVIISYTGGGGGGGSVSVAKCDKLQKSLMLLGTYYNLFLLVDYNPLQQQQRQQQKEQEELDRDVVKQFRNDLLNVATTKPDDNDLSSNNNGSNNNNNNDKYKLTPQILPPHRIIFTSTPEGKIAFVRQLHETKLVLMGSSSKNNNEDNTMKVKVELERFGFRVVSYPDCHTGGDEGVSALGQFLIP